MSERNKVKERLMLKKKDGKIKSTSLYNVLDIEPESTIDEIKNAYYKLAKQYHPDTVDSDDKDTIAKYANKFEEIKKAYIILSDEFKRKQYNQALSSMFYTLKGNERDTNYHKSTEYSTGDKMFDTDKFNEDFKLTMKHEERKLLIELENSDTKNDQYALDSYLRLRAAEKEVFGNQTCIDPKKFDSTIFNQMYDYLKETKRDKCEIDEYTDVPVASNDSVGELTELYHSDITGYDIADTNIDFDSTDIAKAKLPEFKHGNDDPTIYEDNNPAVIERLMEERNRDNNEFTDRLCKGNDENIQFEEATIAGDLNALSEPQIKMSELYDM